MGDARQRLGREAEDVAARRLAALGYLIVERNARVPRVRGEIDLVARDGPVIVFVEVKARSASAVRGPDSPLEMVSRRKQAKLRSLAAAWLTSRSPPRHPGAKLRFDVVGITLDGRRVAEWRHVRAAF